MPDGIEVAKDFRLGFLGKGFYFFNKINGQESQVEIDCHFFQRKVFEQFCNIDSFLVDGEANAFGTALDAVQGSQIGFCKVVDKDVLANLELACFGMYRCNSLEFVPVIKRSYLDVFGGIPDQGLVVIGTIEFELDFLLPLFGRNGVEIVE